MQQHGHHMNLSKFWYFLFVYNNSQQNILLLPHAYPTLIMSYLSKLLLILFMVPAKTNDQSLLPDTQLANEAYLHKYQISLLELENSCLDW